MIEQRILARARALDGAACSGTPIPQGADGWTPTPEQALAVQRALVACRTARGERLVGVKMALTDPARRATLGVPEAPMGWLTDAMRVEAGSVFRVAGRNGPRLEAEIALRLRRPLAGEVSLDEALDAVGEAMPALELVEGRYAPFRFDLADLIADNTSACGFVLGEPVAPGAVAGTLDALAMSLRINGAVAFSGSSAAINGHPANSLRDAARLAARGGSRLEAGWIVLAGSACDPMPLPASATIELEVAGLGRVGLRTGPAAREASR